MNRLSFRLPLLAILIFAAAAYPQNALRKYWQNRFDAQDMQIEQVEGLAQHIVDGKLHLRVRDFLALVLRNSPDIQLTKLDVYTPADQLTGARAPFDPTLNLSFNTVRSVSPLSYSISGSPSGGQFNLPQTINSLSQTSTLNYQQILPTGQTVQAGFTAYRSSGEGYSYPSLFGVLNFQVTQPLLQNRSNLQFLTPIRIAKTEILISAKQSEATINAAIGQIAQQYWDAVLARDTIRVDQ
jgi:outer membrane protein TolC